MFYSVHFYLNRVLNL